MNQSRLICYVDEAGCSGGKYGEGSSEFLTMGAVVYDRSHEPDILKVFDETRLERQHDRVLQKFSKASDSDNFVLTRLMATKALRVAQVALHKPSMEGTFSRAHHKEEYQYLAKFLIERISWIARDSALARGIPDTKCHITFSEQKMYPYGDLVEYLEKLRKGKGYNTSIEWKYIEQDFDCTPHVNEAPVHLADIAASAIARAIEPKAHGMTDDRFQRNLSPALYRKHGRQFGVKLFPSKEVAEMTRAGKFAFMRLL